MGKISIVIPCYNAASFIEETLLSILEQDYENYEVILIDDGSTDNSLEIIQKIAPLFAKKITIKTGINRGVSAARNHGTTLATGDYIQYLDADDLLTTNTLSLRIALIEKENADVVYTNWQKLLETEAKKFVLGEVIQRRIDDIHPDPEIALFTKFWCPPAALLYRRSLVEKLNWRLYLPMVEDARFMLDACLQGGKFSHLDQIGAYYRVRQQSLSRSNNFLFVSCCYRNACDIESYWSAKQPLNHEQKKALYNCFDYTARTIFYYDQSLFQENIQKLYALSPYFQLRWPKIAWILEKLFGYNLARFFLKAYRK